MNAPQNRKPRAPRQRRAGVSSNPSRSQFSSATTAAEAQRQRALDALRAGPKTSHDLRRLGIYQCPARIKELRDRFGHNIVTERVSLIDADGYPHKGCALYTLLEDAPGGAT